MLENIEPLWVITGILFIHLFFFLGFQYQLLNMLDEITFPSDDPIMTSSLKEPVFDYDAEEETPVEETPEEAEEFEYAKDPTNIDPNHGHDLDHIEEVEKEIALEEEPVVETQIGYTTVNQLRRMKKDELIDLCDRMGLDTDGTKTVLVDRIAKNQ